MTGAPCHRTNPVSVSGMAASATSKQTSERQLINLPDVVQHHDRLVSQIISITSLFLACNVFREDDRLTINIGVPFHRTQPGPTKYSTPSHNAKYPALSSFLSNIIAQADCTGITPGRLFRKCAKYPIGFK